MLSHSEDSRPQPAGPGPGPAPAGLNNNTNSNDVTNQSQSLVVSQPPQEEQAAPVSVLLLDVNVSVPVAAPVSITLDSFVGRVPMPAIDNDNSNDDSNDGHHGDLNSQHFNSHSHSHSHSHSMHHAGVSVPVPAIDSHSHLDQDQDLLHDQSTHTCMVMNSTTCTGRTMIGGDHTDQQSQPPTPQFDSNATQIDDIQGHQVHVDVEMHSNSNTNGDGHDHDGQHEVRFHGHHHPHHMMHHLHHQHQHHNPYQHQVVQPVMHHGHETMIPIQQATADIDHSDIHHSQQEEAANNVIDEHFIESRLAHHEGVAFSPGGAVEMYGQEHNDNDEDNDGNDSDEHEGDDDIEIDSEDTLEILKAAPLAETAQEFEDKYPSHVRQTPPNSTPILIPNPSDILFGRGGLTNHHPGNKVYRTIVDMHKEDYQNAAKIVKPRVARRIVHAIRHSNLGARFLRKDPHTNMWQDVGDKIASEKTSQALREKSPEEKKKALKEKVNEDTTAVGISMPHLQLVNGEGVIVLDTQHPAAIDTGNGIYAASGLVQDPNAPVVMVTANISAVANAMDASQASGIIVPAAGNADLHQPTMAYPIGGGTFGTVNAAGQIVVTDRDILCGRGGATNHHPGNKRFRDLVAMHRPDYVAAPKISKPAVARRLVRAIRMANPPGRFLRKNNDSHWVDIGDKKAAEKASQALREKGPEARKESKETNETDNYPGFLEDFDHVSAPVAAPIGTPVAAPITIIDTHLEMIDNSDLEITSPDFKRLKRSDEEEDKEEIVEI